MTCPVCGETTVLKNAQVYCPSCEITVGALSNSQQFTKFKPEEDPPAQVYRQRSRKRLLWGLLTVLIIVAVISPGLLYFLINYTSFGYREKVMYKYGFTATARNYLRSETTIDVMNLSESKPFGIRHSGFWRPDVKNIRLNTASDEVAIHEFAHAWWEELRKDSNTKKGLINDMIKLSKMSDNKYEPAIERAQWIVSKYCSCSGEKGVNFNAVDDHHFYAPMAEFTMGKFKDGPHQLPQFMWQYFEGLFSNNLKVVPCFETSSCGFPHNNNPDVSQVTKRFYQLI